MLASARSALRRFFAPENVAAEVEKREELRTKPDAPTMPVLTRLQLPKEPLAPQATMVSIITLFGTLTDTPPPRILLPEGMAAWDPFTVTDREIATVFVDRIPDGYLVRWGEAMVEVSGSVSDAPLSNALGAALLVHLHQRHRSFFDSRIKLLAQTDTERATIRRQLLSLKPTLELADKTFDLASFKPFADAVCRVAWEAAFRDSGSIELVKDGRGRFDTKTEAPFHLHEIVYLQKKYRALMESVMEQLGREAVAVAWRDHPNMACYCQQALATLCASVRASWCDFRFEVSPDVVSLLEMMESQVARRKLLELYNLALSRPWPYAEPRITSYWDVPVHDHGLEIRHNAEKEARRLNARLDTLAHRTKTLGGLVGLVQSAIACTEAAPTVAAAAASVPLASVAAASYAKVDASIPATDPIPYLPVAPTTPIVIAASVPTATHLPSDSPLASLATAVAIGS